MLTRKQLAFLKTIPVSELRKYLKQNEFSKTGGFLDDSTDYIKRNWDYSKYLAKHKYYVAKAGLQLGVPPLTLAVHDWSKFGPTEYPVYREWFYGDKGRLGDKSLFIDFRKAVQHHYDSNSHGHHWYKSNTPLEMVPLEYRLESLSDWYGVYAGNWKGPDPKLSFGDWYKKHRATLPLDPITKSVADQKIMYGL